jgi:hypothetical protein
MTNISRVVFQGWLLTPRKAHLKASHLSYAKYGRHQYQATVKVHGVFPSCRGYVVSSPQLQFHRVRPRDSAPVVTPFMHVGTYPTRNFATLGPSTSVTTLQANPSFWSRKSRAVCAFRHRAGVILYTSTLSVSRELCFW